MKVITRVLIPALLAFVPFASVADSVESVFQAAERYTVKLRTTTLHPFLDDEEGVSTGSGFLLDKNEGWILTNRHVAAEGPSEVEVRFKDTGYFEAEKVYLDPNLDLAILKIDPDSIPGNAIEAPLGCYDGTSTGNAVVIYGHPSGLNFTGTRGIVSGTIYTYRNEWIQTDAPLNFGNSGGPLIGVESGKVVGVNTARHGDDDTEGLNFAIAIDHVCRIVELIKSGRNPSPPALPIIFVNHDLDDPKLEVARSLYADKSLLLPGDVITGIEGQEKKVTNIDQLNFLLRGTEGKVPVRVLRKNKSLTVTIPVTPAPYMLDEEAVSFSGVTIKNLHLLDGAENNLNGTLFVVGVNEGSSADWTGFETWDSIYAIDGVDVSNLSLRELHRTLLPFNGNGEEVSFILRYFSSGRRSVFQYYSMRMEIEDLEIYTQ